MLAWRIVTRPATTIRRLGGSQLQRRFIHPSRSQLQVLPQLNTWLAKIRFRADGKPRSKLIALGFGSLILCNLLSLHTLIDTINDGNKTLGLLAKMVYVRRMDIAYDSVNFDDPISTLSYFKKLYINFALNSEEAEQIFNDFMMQIIKKKTKRGSTKSVEVRAQDIMRLAAEKIHGAFRELNQDSIVITAEFVMLVMQEALKSLTELLYDDDEDDSLYKFTLHIRDHAKKDAGASKDYEVLG